MKKTLSFVLIIASAFVMLSCGDSKKGLGSEKNPVKFFFTPSVDAKSIAENAGKMAEYLENKTGLHFEYSIPANYITVIESFGSNRADVAIMNSFGYLVANNKYNAHAKMMITRYGTSSYKGQIIAHADSGINSLEDITDKSFAYTDFSSASGYLLPKKILDDKGVIPGNTIFGMKHDHVVSMVYKGEVDAGATYYTAPSKDGKIRDARARVLNEFPDVKEKVKIIATTESIPNDPVVFRDGIPEKTAEKIMDALKAYATAKEGKKVLLELYSTDGFVKAQDKDYDNLREKLKSNNTTAESLLK